MKKILLILWLTSTLSAACGQSIITSPKADSLVLQKFLSNTAAIRDSLVRFEFTKMRLQTYQFDYALLHQFHSELTSQYSDLNTRHSLLNTQHSVLGTQYSELTTQNSHLKKKLRNSRIEKWTWRIAFSTLVYFKVRPYF